MRISDWRSDVCSSDLPEQLERQRAIVAEVERLRQRERLGIPGHRARVGEVARLGIDQSRGEQMFGERRVALKEDGIMMLDAERDRSEGRWVGEEGVRTGRSWWSAGN